MTTIHLMHEDCLLYHMGLAIAWHPSGKAIALSSVEGEVVLQRWYHDIQDVIGLEEGTGGDISHLAFSADGRFLAAGGGGGRFQLWEIDEAWNVQLLERFKFRTPWIDRLVWHPSRPCLAIGTGKTVQLWHGETRQFKGVLDFAISSVLDLAWDATGDRLAASGNLAVKIWRTADWNAAPIVLDLPSASQAIGWSPDGQYFAVGTFDRRVFVLACDEEMTMEEAWVMRGFPAKISSLAWSPRPMRHPDHPTLAVVSAEGVLLWDRAEDEAVGWVGEVAVEQEERIGSIAWSSTGLAIATSQVLMLWQPRPLGNPLTVIARSHTSDKYYQMAWHPTEPILAILKDARECSVEIWRIEVDESITPASPTIPHGSAS